MTIDAPTRLDARVSPRWSADEITEAYAAFHGRVQEFAETGRWEGFADLFTEDATYVEHAFGTFHGREEIRDWSVRTMTTFPGGTMTGFPLARPDAWSAKCAT